MEIPAQSFNHLAAQSGDRSSPSDVSQTDGLSVGRGKKHRGAICMQRGQYDSRTCGNHAVSRGDARDGIQRSPPLMAPIYRRNAGTMHLICGYAIRQIESMPLEVETAVRWGIARRRSRPRHAAVRFVRETSPNSREIGKRFPFSIVELRV